MEDLKGSSDDLQKALAELQEVREQQVGVDNKLASMKRSLPDASGSPPSKLSCQCAPIPVESGEAEDVLDSGPSVDNDSSAIMIQDVTSSVDDGLIGLVTPLSPSQTLNLIGSPSFSGEPSDLLEGGDHISPVHMMPSFGLDLDMTNCPLQITEDSLEADDIGDLPLDLHSSQTSDSEDTAAVIDSILNGDHLSDQSMGFMNRDEMQDFMNCIETNLEDLHSMLAARKLAEDTGLMFEASTPEFPDLNMNEAGPSSSMNDVLDLPDIAGEDGMMDEFGAAENRDMQLVQYMGNPLLSLFDDLPSFEDRPQDDRDLLAEFEDDNNMPTFLEDSDDPLCLVAPSLSDDSENPLESFESPLLLEDPNGEYKLFPLLLLSPVASFIEEATEMENTT
uniref:Heat shock factor protein 3-like n=2 Tax=Monodelphis domestica TaxID=13616 RepID=A0A5F8GCM4_MONDO